MALKYRFRDLFSPPARVLAEADIGEGSRVLDFGCGPGSFTLAAANLVGESGRVYALDVHPLAVNTVEALALKKRLGNIQVIQSDCETGLADQSVDTVILFDTFHHLSNPADILSELHRVLKEDGVLSFSDHHMSEADILSSVTQGGLFRPGEKGRHTHGFTRVSP
jgi:ubiquinone/menaquinone biosynthesis C-methylase UbiE